MGAVKKLLVHQLRDKQDYYKGLNKKKVILHNKRKSERERERSLKRSSFKAKIHKYNQSSL